MRKAAVLAAIVVLVNPSISAGDIDEDFSVSPFVADGGDFSAVCAAPGPCGTGQFIYDPGAAPAFAGDPAGALKSKDKYWLGRRSYSPSTLPPSIPPDPVTVAWSHYADAVIAFNAAHTARNAQALSRSYRSFVSLFVNPDDAPGTVVALHPGGDKP